MLFGLADFRPLQMPDLQCNFFKQPPRSKPVNSCSARGGLAESPAKPLRVTFNPRRAQIFSSISVPRCEAFPTAPEIFPKRISPRSLAKTRNIALIFRKPIGNLQSKGDGFRMDAVGAPDLRSVLKFVRSQVQHFAEQHQIAFDQCEASRTSKACAVSTTSLEVIP